jgi:outer membrane protein
MRRTALLFAVVLGSLGMAAVQAEDLLEVYQLAAESDPTVRAQVASELANREALPQARAGLLPSLSVSANTNYNSLRANDDFNTNNASINLVQPLYRRDRLYQYDQAGSIVSQAEAQLEAVRQDLVIRAAEGYFRLLDAEVEVGFRVADKNAIARQLEQAQRRFEVGLVTITDVYEAQARYDRAAADEIIARNDRSDAQEALRQLTGQGIRTIEFLSADMPLMTADPHDVEAWVSEAMEKNPQVIAGRYAVEAAGSQIEVQRSGHFPNVDAIASYFDDNTNAPNGLDLEGASLGLQLELPIDVGGGVRSRTREAVYLRDQAREQLDELNRSVERQTRDAFRNLDATVSFVRAVSQAVVSNQSGFEATQAGFDVGTRTIVDVLNSQRDLLSAKRDYEVARNQHLLNRLRLKQAAGTVNYVDVEEINTYLQPKRYDWLSSEE